MLVKSIVAVGIVLVSVVIGANPWSDIICFTKLIEPRTKHLCCNESFTVLMWSDIYRDTEINICLKTVGFLIKRFRLAG